VTVLVASLALVFFLPSGAAAGTITFLDATDSLTVTLSADIIARGGSSASCTGEICSITINGPAGNTAAVGGGNVNIFGLEPPTFARALSDVIGFVQISSSLNVAHLNFISDGDPGTPPTLQGAFQGVAALTTDETGALQSGTTITWTTPSGPVVDSIVFSSDVETRPTPEPATLLLLGSGLVGVALWGRRRLAKHVNG